MNHTRNAGPELILCGAEEIALHMAQGYGKVTGKASLVILHDLVGLQHAMMAFYNAWADEVPILVLGGSGPADPADRRAIDWLHSANTQSESVRPYTKWTDEPVTLKAVVDSVLRARRIAESAPQRPTYVSIDAGLQEERLGEAPALPDVGLPRYRPAPPIAAVESEIAAAAELLTGASMPLVFGGRFGRRAEAGPPLVRLIELLGAAYQDGTDIVCVPTAHPQNLNGGYQSPPNPIRSESDVVLGVDCPDLTALVGGYAGARGDMRNATTGSRKVIDLSVSDLGVDHWSNAGGGLAPLDVQLLADPLHGLDQLVAEIERRANGETSAWYRRAQERREDLGERHEKLRSAQRERVEPGLGRGADLGPPHDGRAVAGRPQSGLGPGRPQTDAAGTRGSGISRAPGVCSAIMAEAASAMGRAGSWAPRSRCAAAGNSLSPSSATATSR